MLTTIARICLLLVVLIYFLVGYYLGAEPQRLAKHGFAFPNAENVTAIRTWGGFFVATGLIGSFGVIWKKWTLPALLAATLVSGSVVFARVTGIVVDGMEPRQLAELRDEGTGFAIAIVGLVFAWLGHRRGQDSAANHAPD
ncbi:MAG: DUF4345 family protein [Gammaproteobacteria bacterium]|nr:DUF4345 family protein [Gammaproteobacteria bacterium]